MNFGAKEQGYIYALVNSAMPDLVKVGKTTRSPSDRANELSGVTGVPTPFIVAYELQVASCSEAEKFVHVFLSKKGFRVSSNREFFKAPAYEVINAILAIPDFLKGASGSQAECASQIIHGTNGKSDDIYWQDGDFDGSDSGHPMPPWFDLWNEGKKYSLGLDDYIEDEEEALECFTQAARLGSSLAYYEIGLIHIRGSGGAQKGFKNALSYFKEGARRGNFLCYMEMARLYFKEGSVDSSIKCANLFFTSIKKSPDRQIIECYCGYSGFAWAFKDMPEILDELNPEARSELLEVRESLVKACEFVLDYFKEEGEKYAWVNEIDFENLEKDQLRMLDDFERSMAECLDVYAKSKTVLDGGLKFEAQHADVTP